MVALPGPKCSQLTIEEATEAENEHSDCLERKAVPRCVSEKDLGCAYSRRDFNDVAYKKDSCCELPRTCQDQVVTITCTAPQ